MEKGGYGRRKTRPLHRVVGWLTGCLVEVNVAAEGWSSPGGGKMMGVGVVMTGDGGMETGRARGMIGGRIMEGLAIGVDVEPTGSMMVLA